MKHPHPWRRFRHEHSEISIRVARLPPGVRARTNGRVIELDYRLTQVERRCCIAHEMEHLRRGIPHGGCTEIEEDSIRRAVARILIPTWNLLEAAAWSTSQPELADELWVTVDLLTVRLDDLSPAETDQLLLATTHHREPEQAQWDLYFNDQLGIA